MTEGVFPFAKSYQKGEQPTRSAVCTSLGPSLAAALLNGLFEHPARRSLVIPDLFGCDSQSLGNSHSTSR